MVLPRLRKASNSDISIPCCLDFEYAEVFCNRIKVAVKSLKKFKHLRWLMFRASCREPSYVDDNHSCIVKDHCNRFILCMRRTERACVGSATVVNKIVSAIEHCC
jgi:hypothetical protein